MHKVTRSAALAVILVSTLLASCASEVAPTGTPVVTPTAQEELAALVNGQPITMAEFEKQAAQVEAFFIQEGLDLKSEEGSERLAQARLQVLEQMIDQELIRQAALGLGVSISESQLESSLQDIVGQSGGSEAFDQSLQAMSTTYEDFRQMLLDQLLSEAVYLSLIHI